LETLGFFKKRQYAGLTLFLTIFTLVFMLLMGGGCAAKSGTPRRSSLQQKPNLALHKICFIEGRRFAWLAPRSLRPSGHLRCASSPPPGASVGGADFLGGAHKNGAGARLRFGR
jgi:hypothetical protein